MKIKSGDNIIVITGKDKGKSGKVIKAFPKENMVLIEGVNVKKRHQRANRQDQKGSIIERSHPINVSNVKKQEGEAEAKPKQARKTKAKAE
jgi:large subunit ribosomal protein L24